MVLASLTTCYVMRRISQNFVFQYCRFESFSDHSFLTFSIKCENVRKENQKHAFISYKWNEANRDEFRR